MIHNESVNIWTHLIGAILVVFLIAYTAIEIKANKSELIDLLDNKWTTINHDFINYTEPLLHKIHSFPSFMNLTHDINEKYTESLKSLHEFSSSVKNSTLKYMRKLDEKVGSYGEYFSENTCVECIKDILNKFSTVKDQIHNNYEDLRKNIVDETLKIYNITMKNANITKILFKIEKKIINHVSDNLILLNINIID
jgi:hypothetical protein